jgi:hypothetical protein
VKVLVLVQAARVVGWRLKYTCSGFALSYWSEDGSGQSHLKVVASGLPQGVLSIQNRGFVAGRDLSRAKSGNNLLRHHI